MALTIVTGMWSKRMVMSGEIVVVIYLRMTMFANLRSGEELQLQAAILTGPVRDVGKEYYITWLTWIASSSRSQIH